MTAHAFRAAVPVRDGGLQTENNVPLAGRDRSMDAPRADAAEGRP